MIEAAGGKETAGKKLKSASGWHNDSNGSDEYGFSALPGGTRLADGKYGGTAGKFGYWWTATESGDRAYFRIMNYGNDEVRENTYSKDNAFAVRCLRD